MINISNELKAKLLAAKSVEEVTELVKADGQEITEEEAAHLWEEITRKRAQDGKELSLDELEAVSGGWDRDWAKDGCAATVEPGSVCWSDDACTFSDVIYGNAPLKFTCPQCGMWFYKVKLADGLYIVTQYRCKRCGYIKEERSLLGMF